jgi:O-antigen/teichoic acid export membrane protein
MDEPVTSIGKRIKSLISDVSMYGVSTVAGQLVAILLLPIFTRVFSTEEYGVIALLGLITLALPPVASAGMPSVVMRFLPYCKTDRERHELVGLSLAIASIGTLLLVGAGFVWIRPLAVLLVDDPQYAQFVGYVLLTGGLAAISDVPYTVLRSERRTKLVAGTQITGALGGALLSIYLVVVLHKGLWGYFIAGLAAQSFAAFGKFWLVRRSMAFRFDAGELRRVLAYGMPIIPHRILGLVMVVWARYAIKEHLSIAEAGLYAVAAKVARPLERLVGMFQQAWTPFKIEESAKNPDAKRVFRTVFIGYAALLIFLWLGASLFGPPALRLLTAKAYWESENLIPAIAVVPVCLATCWMMTTGLELGFNMARMPLVTLAAATASVGSSFVLIPWLGAAGAALSIAVGHLTFAAVVFYLSQKAYPIAYDWGAVCILASSAGAAVLLVYKFEQQVLSIPSLVLRTLGLAIYLAIAYLLVRRTPAGATIRHRIRRVLGLAAQR